MKIFVPASVVRIWINDVLIQLDLDLIGVYLLTSVTERVEKVSVTARFSYTIIRVFALTMYDVFSELRLAQFDRVESAWHSRTPFRQMGNLFSLHILSLVSSLSNEWLCCLRRRKCLIEDAYTVFLHLSWQTFFSFSFDKLLKFLRFVRLKVKLVWDSRWDGLRPADHFGEFGKARLKREWRLIKSIVHVL